MAIAAAALSETNPSVAGRRSAEWMQGRSLAAAAAWLGVFATSLISPVLPRLAAYGSSTPHPSDMIQLAVALLALFVTLLVASHSQSPV